MRRVPNDTRSSASSSNAVADSPLGAPGLKRLRPAGRSEARDNEGPSRPKEVNVNSSSSVTG